MDDLTDRVTLEEFKKLAKSDDDASKKDIVGRICRNLRERRDAYNGIVSNIIYVIDSRDTFMICHLKQCLIEMIASHPMCYGGKMFITRCIPRLISDRPEFVVVLLESLMRFVEHESYCKPPECKLGVKIIALKALNQVQQRTGEKLVAISETEIHNVCKNAILSADATTKVDALCLIFDTKVTTRIINENDFEIFKQVFIEAINFQVPSLRQKFLALINKILKRMRDSIRVVLRDRQRFTPDESQSIRERYINLLIWLVESCLDNIYCNKYFGSFIITLTTLNYIVEHIGLDNPSLAVGHLFINRRYYDSILSCISLDSFEENKILALKLLFASRNGGGFQIAADNLKFLEETAYQLVNSVNPAHSLTCQYIFQLVIGLKGMATNLSKNKLIYYQLDKLVTLVEEGIRVIKRNSVISSETNVIYPKLSCIRALLSHIDAKDLDEDRDNWAKLARRVVDVSITACRQVSVIVCNMNPETIGHLPMDLNPIDLKILSETFDITLGLSDDQLQTVSSQHLLITGWKTIKECSLSMAAICSQLWWHEDDKYLGSIKPILDLESLKTILNFFEHYLRNLRHRGAFEQAYNGFATITKRVWPSKIFRELLTKSLHEIMNDFSSQCDELSCSKIEYLKNHVTRRSAGLPFLVQAIVISENREESRTLRWAMNSLLDNLENSKTETYQRIHCLNILKALIKDYNLGEKVVPFIERTLLITIESFKSDDFPIRNCANMLMRVVVDRIFGVNRLRDDIHKRNTLSFEKFFSEHPNLQTALLGYLFEGLVNRKALASVHAVIIILNRLRPNAKPSEDYAAEIAIAPFIEPLVQLSRTCPDFKLRELSAYLVVQLESYCSTNDGCSVSSYVDRVDELTKNIIEQLESHSTDFNKLHGLLSMLKAWLQRCGSIDKWAEDDITKISKPIEALILTVIQGDLDTKLGPSSSLVRVKAFDVAETLLLVYPDTCQPWVGHLLPFLLNQLDSTRYCVGQLRFALYFESMIFKSVSLLITSRCLPSKTLDIVSIIAGIIRKPPNRIFSLSLQSVLIRFIRQSYDHLDDFVDRFLLDSQDLDSTAAHLTPIDQLNRFMELDSDQARWSKYCRKWLDMRLISDMPRSALFHLLDFEAYKEFNSQSESSRSLVQSANTPRAIELLALATKTFEYLYLSDSSICVLDSEAAIEKLGFLVRLIRSIPDCDIKCLSLLLASKLFKLLLKSILQDEKQCSSNDVYETVRDFTILLDELVDGQHDRITRKTCAHILGSTVELAIDLWNPKTEESIMNLLSTLIKLCQDEEYDVRQAGQEVLDQVNSSRFQGIDEPRERLEKLITLITTKFLDPTKPKHIMDCFYFIMRIIFDHSRNYLVNLSECKESLFDKTKPNIFADHIASVLCTLRATRNFFKKIGSNKLSIDCFDLPPEVKMELKEFDTDSSPPIIGDYSWRMKSSVRDRNTVRVDQSCNNRTFLDKALGNIVESLNYFNHKNMLIDTNFGYQESLLFKRLAFVNLLMRCTDYKNPQLCDEIQNNLEKTIDNFCATTILCKCRELLIQEL